MNELRMKAITDLGALVVQRETLVRDRSYLLEDWNLLTVEIEKGTLELQRLLNQPSV